MRRSREDTHRRILDAAYALFNAQGFGRANVDEIAAAASVTKRTLYDHVRSKDDLLTEVLEHQSSVALKHTLRWDARSRRDPVEFIQCLFEELSAWMASSGSMGSGFSRIVMELADLPGHPARKAASRHKAALESWLANELSVRGIWDHFELARQVVVLWEGVMLLTVTHGDRRYLDAACHAAKLITERQPRG